MTSSALGLLSRPPIRKLASRCLHQAIRAVRKLLFLLSKVESRIDRQPSAPLTGDEWTKALLTYYTRLQSVSNKLVSGPKISVIVPVYKVSPGFLQECLASVTAQIYSHWELCIVDDCSEDDKLRTILEEFGERWRGKVKIKFLSKNSGISLASNEALNLATGDFVALLDHDDRLLPNALLEMARTIDLHGTSDIFYSDESRISEEGSIENTFYKPDWSPLFNLSCHYSTHLTVIRRTLLQKIEGFRAGFDGAQDHDLMLRAVEATKYPIIHVPMVLYQWRAHSQSTARSRAAKPYAAEAGERAVAEACRRRGWPAAVEFDRILERYRVRFEIRDTPLVSILIPTKDNYELISRCLNSLFENTSYAMFEVFVVDHESKCHKCLSLFESLERRFPSKFRRIAYQGSFNFAAMNNLGAQASRGTYLLLLNNDTEVQTRDWIQEMLAIAQLPDSGAVGAKLLLENGRIQHAGVVGLSHRVAGNAGLGLAPDSVNYYSYLQVTHEVLAVTAACLLVKKEKYLAVGGLDEIHVPNGYGDVDFCLRLKERGWASIYVPHAVLTHKESYTRKASFEAYERWYMLNKWGRELTLDPYLNFNLEKSLFYRTDFDSLFTQLESRDMKAFLNQQDGAKQ